MNETQILTIAARRIATARGITSAAAVAVLAANPDVLALLRLEITALSPEQLAREEFIDSPDPARAPPPPPQEAPK
jgi:hypothetical protein